MSGYRLSFSHLGFVVRDIDRMLAFYRDVLGFFLTDQGELNGRQLRFLSRSPTDHHQVVLMTGRGEDQPTTINQISFRVGGLGELKSLHTRLVSAGTEGLDPASHGNAWSIYFPDPEGNRIEVFTDSDWYVSQPCKVPVDFTRSEAELRADQEALCRGLPGFKPIGEWHAEMRALMGMA